MPFFFRNTPKTTPKMSGIWHLAVAQINTRKVDTQFRAHPSQPTCPSKLPSDVGAPGGHSGTITVIALLCIKLTQNLLTVFKSSSRSSCIYTSGGKLS